MTKPGYTHLVLVVDRSGSMARLARAASDGIGKFIEDQKRVPGEATLSLYDFDSGMIPGIQLPQGPADVGGAMHVRTFAAPRFESGLRLTRRYGPDLIGGFEGYQLMPDGGTPLYDAVGRVIDETGEYLAAMPEDQRPEHVIVAVVTDGGENSSTFTTVQALQTKIEHQTSVYGWQFAYLSSDLSAVDEAVGLGFATSRGYEPSQRGTNEAYSVLSASVATTRGGGGRIDLSNEA